MHGRRHILPPLAAAVAVALCGCNPRNTRLPVPGPLPPVRIEGPSQERFDPFADEDLGPDTFTRPPDFQNGRDNTRTLLENRRGGRPPASQGPLNAFPGLGGRYPNVVP